MDYFHAQMPYNPSEIIVFPCKGKPSLLLDQMAPQAVPYLPDYMQQVNNTWGYPVVYRFLNDSLIDVNEFITVYDEALFDYQANAFTSNVSTMEYQIFVGSQSEVNTPGNSGQITVTRFESKGNGSVSIRFAPARQPN